MKVRKLLELQSNIEERKVPCDLCDDELKPHYSESKGEFKNILDMDLIHLVRSYSKCLSTKKISMSQQVKNDINEIENLLNGIRDYL